MGDGPSSLTAVERMWHMSDSHSQIMALASQILALAIRQKSSKSLELFLLRSRRENPNLNAAERERFIYNLLVPIH